MPDGFFARLAREAELAGLHFLIVGGHAVNAYGYQSTTLDADLLIAESALPAWKAFWEARGYRSVHTTDAFCQFQSVDAVGRFPVDLMVVNDATFEKMRTRQQRRDVGGASLDVPDPLHLIALKLHALRSEGRARQGRDLPDILGLIHGCRIDTGSVEFEQILKRYADEATRKQIDRALHPN